MNSDRFKELKEKEKFKQMFKNIDDPDYLHDDDVLFILHRNEVIFLFKLLNWFIKKYPKSKHMRVINDILSCLKK